MSNRTRFEFNRAEQSNRKLLKVCDIQYIIKSIIKANIVVNSVLTPGQKILSKIQRENLIEDTDVTEGSDQISDLFDKNEKVQDNLRSTLMQMTKTKTKLLRLDRVLLKGFYTNNRQELEN